MMPSAISTLLRWSLRGYAVYLLLCLLLIMPALNIIAPRLVKSLLHRELGSELLFFNPFTLTLEGRGVTITEHDGHVPLGFDRLQINLSLESLWSTGVVLDAFYLDELDLHVLRDADGQFHFADLLQTGPDTPDPGQDSALFPITIHDLRIEAHTLRFTDATRPGPYTTAQTDLRIRTQNLTTVPDRQSEGDLVLTGNRGGQLRWQGDLRIHGRRSNGQVILENIDLTPLWLYDAETLPFVLNSARLDAVLNYTVDWSRDLQATLSDSEVRLHEVDVIPAKVDLLPDTAVSLRELAVSGIALDLARQDLALAALTLEGLDLSGFDESGEPSLLAMFAGDPPPASAPGSSDEPSTTDAGDTANNAPASETAWTVALANFALSESGITWRTGYLAPEVMRIAPLTAKATSVSWPAQGDTPFQLALSINETSSLDVDGRINISSGDGKARIALQNWSLPWLNPLVNEQTRSTIGRGDLSLDSTLSLAAFTPTQIDARVTIDDYSTILEESGEEAFTFAALAVDGITVDIPKQSLGIESIALNRPSGSLHIRDDGTINVNGIVRGNDDQSTAIDEEPDSNNDEGAPWQVQLTHFSLRDGRLDFADASLPLHFQTVIGGIEADVRDVDTASEQALKIELKGAVDGYAPVVILASGKPFATRRDGELQFTFRGMDIASMSPYSGTYAGYTIDSGTLSLDLRYALDGQALKGDNRIVISKMELGDPVESALAIDAPLKLGIALLTDSKGVIDLSVPISGDLDSPDFSLGPIIGRALKNIIVKAVTAPFSLLAGLVGSDDDLEHIAFAAGSSALDSDAKRAVDALGEALKKRPQLSLRISGGAEPRGDTRALKDQLLRESLLADGLTAAMIDARDEAFVQAVQARYESLAAATQPVAGAGTDKDVAGLQADLQTDIETMWRAISDSLNLPANALQDLATQRAATAKRELVTVIGIDPQRIAISFDAALIKSGLEMTVDT